MKELFRRKSIGRIMQDVHDHEAKSGEMRRNLTVRDLTALGIAAIVGAGIFGTIGNAAASGGPAISLLFILTAVACGFSAMCYAQFASTVPISGSAYTYAYTSFGEIIAWIIGWDLIMEYAVGNIAVAISWSDYFTSFMNSAGMHIPSWLSVDYLTASRGFRHAAEAMSQGTGFEMLTAATQEAWHAWQQAPELMGVRIIADLPAFMIVVFITFLVYKGIRETKMAGNIMVLLKLIILMVIIVVGAFFVKVENWSPFAPNGVAGVLKGVAGVFFAYIGFDAISTTAEECRNPQRDLPRAMILSLVITTVLYVLISLVLTGIVHYSELQVGDPLAFAFEKIHMTRLSGVIAISAIIAMASVLLVFQVGQPRIWMSMSRDGLLPKAFSKIHPKYKTPSFSTIITGIMVAIPSLFLNLTEVTDLTSIGTLFAFVLVSGGVLLMGRNAGVTSPSGQKIFRVPYYNSRYFLPPVWALVLFMVFYLSHDMPGKIFNTGMGNTDSFWTALSHRIPILVFAAVAVVLTIISLVKQLSVIPIISVLLNLYLMTELGITNWLRFLIWLVIGLCIYFLYGRKHSRLNRIKEAG